ncbi:NADPH-dependent F420 reductase [Streptomyces sp. BK340]|uniref:NADPH-dependent F420 reductase n=1 Tax=Streptomyces sp. BK340 TaxID=2572903 RepID=UPI0011A11E01|nr:NAD(P)-binding domain-containing protein [Streptomyces sp. BK340]TVZ90409.1 hypothetical protein FB157_11166 [Streptomyces sp. BK340]
MKIAVMGTGNVGLPLANGLEAVGHDVTTVDSSVPAEQVAALVADADTVVLALPYDAALGLDERVAAALSGKTVIDATNPLASDYMSLRVGHTTSGGEQVAAALPGAKVIKAFSSVLAPNHAHATMAEQQLFLPVAGDDELAKKTVIELATELGFDAVDAGPLSNARYIEPATELLIQLAYGKGLGTGIGLVLARA